MDKKALLDELKIDRSSQQVESARPIKWFILIAIIGGIGFAAWSFQFPRNAAALEVRTVLAQAPQPLSAENSVLDATGYVIARRMATVSSKVTGKVMEVLIEEGMAVAEGQVLATLDDSINRAQLALAESQVLAARAGIAELEVQLQQAQLDLSRTQDLAARDLISQADLDRNRLSVEGLQARIERSRQEIEVAERSTAIQRQLLDDMQIRAPFAGVVIAKAAQPGEMISPIAAGGGFTATGICTIVDMDSLEVEVDVNEAYINRVYPGQPATISLNAYTDEPYRAEVIAIIPAANRNQATVRVRVGFVERDERVLPEMGVRVSFLDATITVTPDQEGQAGVLIPDTAIEDAGEGPFVWVVLDNKVTRRGVEVGAASGQRILVIAGLESGERVVSNLDLELLSSLEDGLAVNVLN